ncbi:MAG: nucleoside-diphosphate kinase [Desulfatiglandaceae bacterium]
MNLLEEELEIMMERTLGIIKPDGVSRNLTGEVLSRIEKEGFTIHALKMIRMSKKQAEGFYAVHIGKPFFESVTNFMSSGSCVVMVLEEDNAISRYRELMGSTDPGKAAEGTIRKLYGSNIERNVVHGSDSRENAEKEIRYFFSELDLLG